MSALMLFISTYTMDNCPTCQRHVLPHAMQVKCSTCHRIYHMKCISLNLNDQSYIQANRNTWYCVSCITTCFPFNHIKNDDTFKVGISNLDIESKDIESLSQLLFNPFELNNDEIILTSMWYRSWCQLLWPAGNPCSTMQLLFWEFLFICYSK